MNDIEKLESLELEAKQLEKSIADAKAAGQTPRAARTRRAGFDGYCYLQAVGGSEGQERAGYSAAGG